MSCVIASRFFKTGWGMIIFASFLVLIHAAPVSAQSTPENAPDVAGLIQAVQAQIQTVEELKKQNSELVRKNEELAGRLKSLELKIDQRLTSDPLVGKSAAQVPPPLSPLPVVVPGAPDVPIIQVPTVSTELPLDLTVDSSMPPGEFNTLPNSDVAEMPSPSVPISAHPASDFATPGSPLQTKSSEYLLGRYDNGFLLVAPKNPEETPFAMKANIVSQERYVGFFRNTDHWQPKNSKVAIPVYNRSTFDVNRAYLGISGFALSPKLQYSFILATTSTVNVSYVLAVLGYQFNKEFGLFGGFNKVPGSREWFESFKNTVGVDRSMATTFFRPSMSPGVWITGEPLTNFHYYGMISNSINSFSQVGDRQTTQMCYSGNLWWEPLGSFGPGFADSEYHEDLAIRLGTTGLYERQNREEVYLASTENPENTVTRLSNGIPIFDEGAIAPGVRLQSATNRFWSLDAGMKYRGFSLSGEYYMRWLNNFQTDKPMPGIQKMFDQGGYTQLSYAVIPKKLDFYAKTSLVAGPFGSGNDYGGGMNWYINGTRKWRATAEVLQINRSPAFNVLTPYRVGQSGTLMMFQMVTDF